MADNEIIIASEGVKRRLSLPCRMIMSRSTAASLIDQLQLWLSDEAWSYGMFTVWPEPSDAPPNTPPRDWKD